jgi:hypothetical protein
LAALASVCNVVIPAQKAALSARSR